MSISILLKVFFVLVLLVLFFRWIWSRRTWYLLSAKLPGPYSLPFIGSAHRLMCNREDIMERLVQIWKEFAHHPVFALWLGPKLLVIVSGAETIAKVVQCPAMQAKDDIMRNAMHPWIGEGQLTGTGAAWRARRRIIVPTLGRQTIENFAIIFSREFAKMADRITSPEVDLEDYLHPCILGIVCQTVLGTNLPERNFQDPEKDFLHMPSEGYAGIMEAIAKPWILHPIFALFSSYQCNIFKGSQYFRNFIKSIILEKQNDIQLNKKNRDVKADVDFRPLVEEILLCDDIGMSMEELIDEMFTIFLASSDPTNNTACFILLMFAMHPEIQEKAVQEIYEVVGKERRTVTYDDCAKLNFIDMCVKETIRLFQTGPYSLRRASGNVSIDDKLTIPKDTTVLINYFWLHRSPKYWSHPNEFHPGHFLPEEVERRHPNAYMPFSGGARSCIGKLFAVVAIKVLVVNFLWRFRLHVKTDRTVADLRLRCDISVISGEGYKVCLEDRA